MEEKAIQFVNTHSWFCEKCGRRYWHQNFWITHQRRDDHYCCWLLEVVCPKGHELEKVLFDGDDDGFCRKSLS